MIYGNEHVSIIDRAIALFNKNYNAFGSLFLCCRISDAWDELYHTLPPDARIDEFVNRFTDDMGVFVCSINDAQYPHWWGEDMYGYYEERKAFIATYRAHIVNQMSIQQTNWIDV